LSTIYLVRHGTTEWVDTRLLHGITDIPLNERGKKQAHAAAGTFTAIKVDRLYTSPLSRCAQTADFVSKVVGIQPVVLDSLIELDFGWLEGSYTRDHRSGNFGKLQEKYDHFAFQVIRAISGEPLRKFQKRIVAAWYQILDKNPDGTVVVVGHSGVFNALLIHLFGKNFPPEDRYYRLSPASICRIEVAPDGKTELAVINDTKHLPEELK